MVSRCEPSNNASNRFCALTLIRVGAADPLWEPRNRASTVFRGGARRGNFRHRVKYESVRGSHYVEVLRVTAAQVWRYLQKYISVAGNPFGFADWNNINELYKSATSDESLDVVTRIDRFALFLTTVAKFSREQWIQFSHEKIIAGLVCLTGSLMLHARMLYAHVRSNARARSPRTTCARQVDIMINHRGQLLRVLLTATLMTLEWVSRLSNSYIVAEGDSAHFLIASFAFLLLVCTVSGVGDERGGREFGSTRVSSAIFPAFGLLTCNMILHGLGISWVKDGSFDDGSNLGLEMAMHPSVRGFATPLLLVPLASPPGFARARCLRREVRGVCESRSPSH